MASGAARHDRAPQVEPASRLRLCGVAQQHVVVLHFNKQGVLQSVKHVSGKQAVTVAMAGGETKAPGGSASFLQQLIGGVGQYNPGLGAGGSNGLGLGSGATGF